MKAYAVDPAAGPARLALADVEPPLPQPGEALVRVRAVSLNRGEVRRARSTAPSGWRPGWDFAGVVERPTANGSGPKEGARVVGILRSGAWAEYVAAPTEFLAPLPDGVSFEQAATLPVAGLTALHALYKRGTLVGKSVLVTGATGGVGDFAIQLARLSGATVTAHLRRPEGEAFVRAAGAQYVALGDDLTGAARPYAPFDLILESVGGPVLGAAMVLLAERGVCVSFGTSSENRVTFDAQDFYFIGGATLYGLILFDEFKWTETAALGLARLANLLDTGDLKPQISVTADWQDLPRVADDLYERRYPGKAVLVVS